MNCEFNKDVQGQVNGLLLNDHAHYPGDGDRADLTKLKAYTIDDENSIEIDDAVSYQNTGSKDVIWIHIADPCRIIESNSPIDNEAKRRSVSVYLTDRLVPMLPKELIVKSINLAQGKICPALSVGITLTKDGNIVDPIITRSWVQIRYKLSYDDADELINLAPPGDEALYILSNLLEKRNKWRRKKGAIILEQSEGRFIENETGLDIRIISPTPARRLISEAMILMGTVIAEFSFEHEIPLAYRLQAPSKIPSKETLDDLKNDVLVNATIKSHLNRGILSSKPSSHFSLGLSCYAQTTSPIRRYTDMLNHRQIINFLAEDKIFSENEVTSLLDFYNVRFKEAMSIARENISIAKQKWLSLNKNKVFETMFIRWLRQKDSLALCHVNAISMDLPCKIPHNINPIVGDLVNVQVVMVDPLSKYFELLAN